MDHGIPAGIDWGGRELIQWWPLRAKDYFSGKPWTRVRDVGSRMTLMAWEFGQPLCNPHQHFKDIPNKHAFSKKSVLAMQMQLQGNCNLQSHHTSKEIAASKPFFCISIDGGPQRRRYSYCWPSSEPTVFQLDDSAGSNIIQFLPTPGKSTAPEMLSLSWPTPVVSVQCYLTSTAVKISNHLYCCCRLYQLPENDLTSTWLVNDEWLSLLPTFSLEDTDVSERRKFQKIWYP